MRISFTTLQQQFFKVLTNNSFSPKKAELISRIFAENSRDGVYSHGLNRFPVFINSLKEGQIIPDAEPEVIGQHGTIEHWDGHFGPGMYIATLAMQRAIDMAKASGMGCVTVKNSNHWMRGGTYGWQAADAGCVGLCVSNTIANMPPWGGYDPRLGNNPLVISVPRQQGHIVLDMAMSQFSYGKLQEYELKGRALPVAGGYDEKGNISTDPVQIKATKRTLPIGFWKGSGLSFILDVLVASLSGGRSVGQITAGESEAGLSQIFICLHAPHLNQHIIEEIIQYTKDGRTVEGEQVYYPGEKTLAIRYQNDKEGIPVNEEIWLKVLQS